MSENRRETQNKENMFRLSGTVLLIQFFCTVSMQNILVSNEHRKTPENSTKPTEISGKNVKLIQLTELLSSTINLDVNPCDDFYAYACKKDQSKKTVSGNPSSQLHFNASHHSELDIKRITEILENFYKIYNLIL